jgi:nitrogen fixation protein NifB
MNPEEAVACIVKEMTSRGRLNIVAISGPGEPLFNEETFVTLQRVRTLYPDIKICLSTNGLLLSESVRRLKDLTVDTISVSMSAIRLETVRKLYRWAIIGGERISGLELGYRIPEVQLKGIHEASRKGINIKVNTILIPSINTQEIPELSSRIEQAGAKLQNIMPLVPRGSMNTLLPPSKKDLEEMRKSVNDIIPQFRHCKQCRSDVVGIPGCDSILP